MIPTLGVGLGLRREHFGSLLGRLPREIAWFEIAPENYLEIGGKIYRDFCELSERIPVDFGEIVERDGFAYADLIPRERKARA